MTRSTVASVICGNVLNRLKCILKENRKRRCNFPRETEHEIKRGCRIAAAHSLISPPLSLARSPSLQDPALWYVQVYSSLRLPSTRILTIIFPGEAQHPLSHFSPLPRSFSRAQSPVYCTMAPPRFPAISRRWVLKIEKNARRENCVSSSIFFKTAERVHWPRNTIFTWHAHEGTRWKT